jgi:DNA polymerase
MAISERPGTNEDSTGLAFVGRAGELLDKILDSIGMDSNNDILIANVVKCIPPFDRAPRADEAEACLPFLDKQIELVRPRIILLLGAVALRWISRGRVDLPMEEAAGQFFSLPQYQKCEFQVLYHPAYLLRDPRKKQPMWDHVQLLKEKIMTEVY